MIGESGHSSDTFSLVAICSVTKCSGSGTTNSAVVWPTYALHNYREILESAGNAKEGSKTMSGHVKCPKVPHGPPVA